MSQNNADEKTHKLIKDCDELIRAGSFGLATRLLAAVNIAQVPRQAKRDLAKICRRAGLLNMGLRLLQPIVRSEKTLLEPATESEICEYAVLLCRNGSIQEALTLLEPIDSEKNPEVLLNIAYCYMPTWEYSKAATYLEKFLQADVDDYAKLVARVNLAACYHATYNLEVAEELLIKTIPLAKAAGSQRLLVNCFDLMGHVFFQRGNYPTARQYLNEASSLLGTSQTYDHLLIRKTEAFMQGLEHGDLEPLLKFRQEAIESSHWESVREVDLYRNKIGFEQQLFDELYFGSPLPAFRERIHHEVEGTPSESFIYGDSQGKLLDLKSGRLSESALNPGKKIHQVLAILSKDFYSPRNLGSLFSDLYPNEYFDISSSRHRVNQLLSRTRNWLAENNIETSIVEYESTYRLNIREGFGIRLTSELVPISNEHVQWNQFLLLQKPGSEFVASEAREALGWSRSTFRRMLVWALANRKIEKVGSGKLTTYRIPQADLAMPPLKRAA